MLKWLFAKKPPVRCWAIKQVDPGMLHLCELGTLQTDLKPEQALHQVRTGQYQGPVQMGDTGIVLHSQLFAVLIPEQELSLDDQYTAHWQGVTWEVAKVPQRCWTWEGKLEAVRNPNGPVPRWLSVEDVSELRQKASAQHTPSVEAAFRAEDDLESPDKDVKEAIRQVQDARKGKRPPQTGGWDWHRDD
ncbi:hypothetical protein [Halomonas sp.]|uniref:hypothetical protein n=1 Tax=Halomonas sp. TaxID=1486246 RepID=UPI003D0FB135